MGVSNLLLYSKTTGHVLAAATVTATPSGEISAEALAGDFLQANLLGDPTTPDFEKQRITVPTDELLVLPFDAKIVPIDLARTYAVDLKKKTPITIDTTKKVISAVPNAAGFNVTFTPPSIEPTVVWVRVEAANVTAPASAVLPQIKTTNVALTSLANTTIPVLLENALPTGDYQVLVLVPGCVPFLSKIPVP
jgi:hypothetical protein